MAISDVQQALINAGTIARQDVATVVYNAGTASSQGTWFGGLGDSGFAGIAFKADSSDTTGTLIEIGFVPKADPQNTVFNVATIVAYDQNYAILEALGTFYMISDQTAGHVLSGNDSTLYPITDFGTTGSYTPPAPVCFAAGTRIRTERGEIAVEDLVAGDRVCVQDAGAETTRPVIWIGHRDVRLAGCANPLEVQPIRIRSDAFADGMPHRDLLVSPCHAVFVDGRLIPAGLLVNHTSIVRETRLSKVRYFHVELDRHAILFAENLPAESYLDTGNRSFFQNGAIVDINTGRAGMQPSVMRETLSCAPFADAPEAVLPVWDRLAIRAWQLGYGVANIETTTDPAPRLAVNGSEFGPIAVRGNKYSFVLPAGSQEVRLLSRAARPCEARPWVSDERVLGLSVSRIAVRDGADVMDLALDGPAASRGWWALEGNGSDIWRWTNGDASLCLPEASGQRRLELTIGCGMVYPLSDGRMPEVIATAA